MADEAQNGGASSSQEIAQSSESTVEINVKTLDSRIFKFCVKKDTQISILKEKIANATGVTEEQQRLIFRGKVLKDDHLLSTYNLEDGDTLHLVIRQPAQAQSAPGTVSGGSSHVNPSQGTESANGGQLNRTGQVPSHSVVVGMANIGDQGNGMMADIGRVIGAVLQSVGAGVLNPGAGPDTTVSSTAQVAPNNGTGGSQTVGATNIGNQAQPTATSLNQPIQISQVAPFAGPLQNLVIPDSLTTILDFVNRVELILQNNDNRSQSPAPGHRTSSENPVSSTSIPSPERLGSVINRVNQLLSGNVATTFARIAERLQGHQTYSDPVVRNQIQTEAMHAAIVMQHLGSMLLELGRTTQMLRMGQSPSESFVSAGSAVYISPTGPNPIMVQPFPPIGPLFTSSPSIPGILSGSVGAGDLLRNINIHVVPGPNAGDGSRGEAQNTEQVNPGGRVTVDPALIRGMPARTVVTAIPARAPGQPAGHVLSVVYPVQVRTQQLVGTTPLPSQGVVPTRINGQNSSNSGSTEGSAAFQPPASGGSQFVVPLPFPLSHSPTEANLVNEQAANVSSVDLHRGSSESTNVNSSAAVSGDSSSSHTDRVEDSSNRNDNDLYGSLARDSLVSDGTTSHRALNTSLSNNVKYEAGNADPGTSTDKTSISSLGSSPSHSGESGNAVPLGLGLGGLQPKRRNRTTKPTAKDSSSQVSAAPNQSQESIAKAREVLQSLSSQESGSNRGSTDGPSAQLPPVLRQIAEQGGARGPGARGPLDLGSMMSQVLQTPAFNSILSSVSQQTGLASPDDLKSMMEECARSPEMGNTFNDIAQQVEGRGGDLASIFSGSGRGQGGIDFGRIMQQMMPVVSQALGGAPARSMPTTPVVSVPQSQNNASAGQESEPLGRVNLTEARERVEGHSPPGHIFRAVLDGAVNLYGDPSSYQHLIDALGDDTELTNDYIDMLQCDIRQRLEKEK